MNPIAEDILQHYGTKFHSGRYPYGSGEDPYQHGEDFLGRIEQLHKKGLSDTEIAKTLGMTTSQYRTQKSIASSDRWLLKADRARSLREDGKSLNEIAEIMGYKNDSSVRSLLNDKTYKNKKEAWTTAEYLMEAVDKKGMIDVGKNVGLELGVSKERLDVALEIMRLEGYPTYPGRIEQVTNKGQSTTLRVLCPPGTEHKDIFPAMKEGKISSLMDYDKILTEDGSKIRPAFVYPESLDSSRVKIRYAEEGGLEKDGVIEIRRGVEDLSLGNSHYAQVRILVDGTHYLKGMAVYSDKMPEGVDVVFNTNKTTGTPQEKVFKEIKSDPKNPFGSLIKEHGGQSYYIDKDGNEKLSVINKTREEGEWQKWGKCLPSQFLSKQPLHLIEKQLNLTKGDKKIEYDDICAINNPTIKKYFLKSFADDCDAAAEHLKAAALPRQRYQVIMPIPTMKDNEVYAPNFHDGEKVALVRFPHGGLFEIPILTVNNKHKDSINTLGRNPKDAVGINSKIAEQLSGADYDGDTVLVIPCNSNRSKVKIAYSDPLKELEGFDTKTQYKADEVVKDAEGNKLYGIRNGQKFKLMTNTQTEMGKISNLITDMTIIGASSEDLAKAVKHSMVVIDAEKHDLDYKKSEKDNDIIALKRRYQGIVTEDGRIRTPAGTLISRAKNETTIPKTQGSPIVDPETGKQYYKTADDLYYVDRQRNKETGEITLRQTNGKKIVYNENDTDAKAKYAPVTKKVNPDTGEVTYTNKDGDIEYRSKMRTQKSTQMRDTDDARTLISKYNTPQEQLYADYANSMKALANQARKEVFATGKLVYSSSAAHTYEEEVKSLNSKLMVCEKNAPKERIAQVIATSRVEAMKKEHPEMGKSEIKKAEQRELTTARNEVGAGRGTIDIGDREWEAIQAGAISEKKLNDILKYADVDQLRERATPRASTTLSNVQISKIKNMAASGNYSNADIAAAMGVSASTVSKYLK